MTESRTGGTYRNVTVAANGVDLKDMTVLGHLYIDKKVEDGTATLTNMNISVDVYVNGGGDNSVVFENCSISGNIYAQKTSGKQQGGTGLCARRLPRGAERGILTPDSAAGRGRRREGTGI